LLGVWVTAAHAQDDAECPDGRVASITVVRYPVFGGEESRDSASGIERAAIDVADFVHTETKEAFIRRELLFEVGDCADRLRLSESERILRLYRFLEAASVEEEPRPDGDVDVTVTTTDDWSLRLEPRFNFGEGIAFGGVSLAETNFMGRGRTLELAYLIRDGTDDWVFRYVDPQAFTTLWNLELAAIRGKPGWIFLGSIAYPFRGLVGRWAAFQNAFYGEDDFRYFVGDDTEDRLDLRLPTLRRTFGMGGALRTKGAVRGRAARLISYGFVATYFSTEYGTEFLADSIRSIIDSLPAPPDFRTTASLVPIDALRLSAVGGLRVLDYVQQTGVITLRGVEDIPLGGAIDLLAGVAPQWFGTSDSHMLLGLDLYGGSRVWGSWYSILRANGEAWNDLDTGGWRDVLTTAEWNNFWIMNSTFTSEVKASFSAGWRTTVPFQLTLGGPEKIAGYTFDRFPGGLRFAARVESRQNLTRLGRLMDLGSFVNLDVGQMWANGALFGVDSDLRGSVGIGIRFAAPSGSRQAYRLTIGIPFERDLQFRNLVFSFSLDRLLQIEGRQPLDPQVFRSRDPAILDARRYLK
jgi:hypothetical protein